MGYGVQISRFVYYVSFFMILPCILLLSLCFGFTTYITTAKIYIMVFYCLFQDNILGFNMCFSIRYSGFYASLMHHYWS